MSPQQLDLVTRIPCPADHFVIVGDRLYAGARYGDAYTMTIVDVAEVTAPRVIGTFKTRRQVPSLAVVGDVAFVGEYQRSILAVDVRDPAQPRPFDAVVSFRRELSHYQVAAGLLVAAAGRRGVFALDVRDPWKFRPVPVLPIAGGTEDDKPDVEQLTSRDGRIYAAVRNVGCVIAEVADGRLREVGRIEATGFSPDHVLATERCLWIFGSSEGDDDDSNLVVADRATGAIRFRGKTGISHPGNLVDIPGGGLGLHTHYTGSVFRDTDARIEQLFRQYEYDDDKSYLETHFAVPEPDPDDEDAGDDEADDDDSDDEDGGKREVFQRDEDRQTSCLDTAGWMARHQGHLVAVHGLAELMVWKPRPGSVFG